jgi:hypothetical protein
MANVRSYTSIYYLMQPFSTYCGYLKARTMLKSEPDLRWDLVSGGYSYYNCHNTKAVTWDPLSNKKGHLDPTTSLIHSSREGEERDLMIFLSQYSKNITLSI